MVRIRSALQRGKKPEQILDENRTLIAYEHLLGRWLFGTSPNESNPRYMEVRETWGSVFKVDLSDKNVIAAAQAKAEITEGVLNRYTGNIRLFSEGGALVFGGPCAKAEKQKF